MAADCILCVDDEGIILASLKAELRSALGKDIDVETALSGEEGLAIADEIKAEGRNLLAVVTDQRMPGMGGTEFLISLKQRQPDVLGIMLTGFSEVDAIKRAINEAGLFRFISKPWSQLELVMAVRQAVEHRRLETLNRTMSRQLEMMNRTILSTLENIVDINDPETYEHVRRVSIYAATVARAAGMDIGLQRRLFVFSPLHDIGKIGIRHEILAKPGPLTAGERTEMETHVTIGERLVGKMEIDPILRELIRYHHERWDGKGYPDGLLGEAIPLSARVVAIADVFDALVSDRPYKKAMSFDEAAKIIRDGRGSHFDPALVDAFESSLDSLRACVAGESPPDFSFEK